MTNKPKEFGKDAALHNLAYGVLSSIILVPGIVLLAIKYAEDSKSISAATWHRDGQLAIIEHMLQPKEMANAWLGWILVASGVAAILVFFTRAVLCVWRAARRKS